MERGQTLSKQKFPVIAKVLAIKLCYVVSLRISSGISKFA
jgi:hypothetical protein